MITSERWQDQRFRSGTLKWSFRKSFPTNEKAAGQCLGGLIVHRWSLTR
tara:strand:- start:38473 stop:38619 length:147 start_codon:yes stop_codon:yes gene_type:complete